ncbi:MAG: DNA repair protein RadC [Bacteroidetes bacterium]|nr:DNA repair protein RadC [Bacteroidota bacterium]
MGKEKNYISIKNWAEDERPREKLLQKGADSLSDSELLAILIASGTRERSAIELARDILSLAHNHIHELGRLSIIELKKVKGIGEARAVTIAAALELGKRRQINDALQRPMLKSSRDVAEVVIPMLRDLNHEAFCVIYVNNSNRLIRHEIISIGGITGTVVDVRIILKNALLQNANQFFVAHNHPSGNLTPSQADKQLTQRLKEAGQIMDVKLLDHLIVAGLNYFSFCDEGLL